MLEITVKDPRSQELLRVHHLDNLDFVHTNLEAGQCACRYEWPDKITASLADFPSLPPDYGLVTKRPVHSGNSCHKCGGMMVRTGTCETCTECGETGGCG